MRNEVKKTASWSVVVFTMAGIVAYFVTGSLTKAVIIGSCELLWEPPCYFIHEHAWKLVHKRQARRNAQRAAD
jgi:uncharacterized membrane protein